MRMEDGGWRMASVAVHFSDVPQKSSALEIILLSIAPMPCQAVSICLNSEEEMYSQSKQSSSHACVSVASPSASSILLINTARYRRRAHASATMALTAREERRI